MTMTELDSLNKYITEKVFNKCWHEERDWASRCIKCERHPTPNTDFTTPEGWWKLWNEVRIDPELWRKLKYDYQWEEWETLDLQQRCEYIARFKGWKGE